MITYTRATVATWRLPKWAQREIIVLIDRIVKRTLKAAGVPFVAVSHKITKEKSVEITVDSPSSSVQTTLDALVPVPADDPRRVADATFVEEPRLVAEYVAYRREDETRQKAAEAESNAVAALMDRIPKWTAAQAKAAIPVLTTAQKNNLLIALWAYAKDNGAF